MKTLGEALVAGQDEVDGCVILVEFDIASGRFDEFLRLVRENARLSVKQEPGCRRFDVLLPPSPADRRRVVLYEIYDDRGAFDIHLKTAHFLDFDEATRPMVTGKRVVEYRLFEATK